MLCFVSYDCSELTINIGIAVSEIVNNFFALLLSGSAAGVQYVGFDAGLESLAVAGGGAEF